MGAMYTPGMGTLGQSRLGLSALQHPDMYTNLMYPRGRYADGGSVEEPVHHT